VASGGSETTAPADARAEADMVIDALLGTGLNKPPADDFAAAIQALNQCGRPILSLDIPSGLGADSGAAQGVAVQATATITFIGLKRGLFTGAGVVCCGALSHADLDVPAAAFTQVKAGTTRLDPAWLGSVLPSRRRDGHKGVYGHTLGIGGDHGMAGAIAMSAEAALRVGSGLVSVATRAQHAALITSRRPELMVHAVDDAAQLAPLLDKARVVVIGPGLGQGSWGKALLEAALASGKPLVLDADALNLLAQNPVQRPDWILTPHPGEAGTLLGRSSGSVQANRFAALQALGQHYGGVPVLKGAGTLIYSGGQFRLCPYGNPGMGTAGMGDILSGVIGGLRAQGLSAADAAAAGVLVHALAGDDAADEGQRGLAATDLLPFLRRRVNP
jgi:NAD(P)H-hydrate epimerase